MTEPFDPTELCRLARQCEEFAKQPQAMALIDAQDWLVAFQRLAKLRELAKAASRHDAVLVVDIALLAANTKDFETWRKWRAVGTAVRHLVRTSSPHRASSLDADGDDAGPFPPR